MAGWRKYLGILTLLWTVGGQAQTIVQGSAPVRAGNCADAREMAVRQALARAAEMQGVRINTATALGRDGVFDAIQTKGNGRVGQWQILSEKCGEQLLTISLRVEQGENRTPTCQSAYTNRVLVTGFAMEFPEQKLPDELPMLSRHTAVALTRILRQRQPLLADSADTVFPYSAPLHAPHTMTPSDESSKNEPLLVGQARDQQAQYVLSGIYRDFALSGGQRHIAIEAFIHDGINGALLARRDFSATAGPPLRLDQLPSFGSPAFFRQGLGLALGGIFQEIAVWSGQEIGCLPFSARIVRRNGRQLHIDAGAEAGLSIGDTLHVHAWQPQPVYALAGNQLGREKRILGSAVIRSVYPTFSRIELIDAVPNADIRPGDVVFAP